MQSWSHSSPMPYPLQDNGSGMAHKDTHNMLVPAADMLFNNLHPARFLFCPTHPLHRTTAQACPTRTSPTCWAACCRAPSTA